MADKEGLVQRTNESKRRIGRAVSINGVNALELDVKRTQNLDDPILDVDLRINNPIGRLWLALKRIWKSQNTILNFKFTIPLLVLPIILFALYALWQGRGVSTPMSKLGLVHAVLIGGVETDILVLPTSDVYTLSYDSSFNSTHRLLEKPVVVVGRYRHLDNTLHVEDVIAYNPADISPSRVIESPPRTTWENILRFISQFK